MSARPPRPAHYALTPTPVDVGDPFSVGIAFYRTEHELTFYLRALQNGGGSRMVVVLALRAGAAVPPAELPDHARLIQTAAGGPVPDGRIGWFVPDPLQAVVMAITDNQREYVTGVVAQLRAAGFRADADLRNEKIGFKIREAEKAKVPYMLVAGDREVQSGTLSVRGRSGANLGSMTGAAVIEMLRTDVTRTQPELQPTH